MTIIHATWPAPNNIHAFTTTRKSFGNVSKKMSSADTETLTQLLQLPSAPAWVNQVHGTTAVEASMQHHEIDADATYTDQPNRVCAILTADCLPVLICNKQGNKIAAIHAGWRGLAAGIIENTLDKLKIPANETLVWLGPAIGPDKFEVGKDVLDEFIKLDSEARDAFRPISDEKWLANLYQLALMRLHKRGITDVYGGTHCTHTEEDLFYSYRRDKGRKGSLVSLIWMT